MMLANTVAAQDSANLVSGIFQQQYGFYSMETLSQPLNKISNYTHVEAGYRSKGGTFMQAQDATKERTIFFNTQGTRQVKKYLVSGSFNYEQIKQDSVGYTLRYGLNDPAPNYLYAAAKGNWQITKYNLQGIVSRAVAKDKLLVGAGLTYDAHNAWRSNDPRPEYFFYLMDLDATLHYILRQGQSIGVEAGYIRKSTETTINYRNKDYELSTSYPAFKSYLQYGYGFVRLNDNNFFKSQTQGYKAKGIYRKVYNSGEGALKGGYTYTSSKFTVTPNRYELNGTIGWFYEKTWNGEAYWKHRQGNNIYSMVANYIHHAGSDKNVFLNGNNYLYLHEQAGIAPIYAHIKNKFLQYELGLDARYHLLSRADGNAAECAVYKYAEVGAHGAYYFPTNNKGDFLKTRLNLGLFAPIASLLQSPIQEPDFTKNVIYHDYYYYTAHSFSGGLDLQYQHAIKQVKTFLRMQANYQKANIEQGAIQAASLPGDNRWWWQCSVGVNL